MQAAGIESPVVERIPVERFFAGMPVPSSGKTLTVIHIPARSGSVRCPDKNIRLLGGHPLLAYSVRLALNLKGVDMVFVNTDSPRYAGIAQEYGACVPFLRPAELAREDSSLAEAANYMLKRLHQEGYRVGRWITLMPTSPFRRLDLTQEMLDGLVNHVSVCAVSTVQGGIDQMYVKRGGQIRPLAEFLTMPLPEYDWIKILGYFHGININEYMSPEINLYDNFVYRLIKNPIEMIDIDSVEDFLLAERIVSEKLHDFGVDLWSTS